MLILLFFSGLRWGNMFESVLQTEILYNLLFGKGPFLI